MRKIKKINLFLLIIISYTLIAEDLIADIIGSAEYNGLELKISIMRDYYTLGEPLEIDIKIKNISSKILALPESSFEKIPNINFLILMDRPPSRYKGICLPDVIIEKVILQPPPPIYIEPNKELKISRGKDMELDLSQIISDRVYCSIDSIGHYKVTVRYEVPDGYKNSKIPYWTGKLEASVSFDVVEPKGIDALHYNDFIKYIEKEPEEARCICFLGDGTLSEKYPTSIYSAWTYVRYRLQKFSKLPVAEAISLIKSGIFPDSGNWRDEDYKKQFSIKSGPEMAKYERDKLLSILKYHPDFPIKNRLNLQIALCTIVLDEAEGIRQLQNFIQEQQKEATSKNKEISPEGKWAEEFLKQWLSQSKQ